ncbi:hypothetical protein [Actinokineospora fastidiosa]|uniref:Uncharacterized protein n=1 Tax=Actinokineospora fastidiosa TaxID=1816 RepID=A0A918GVJ4_9PSEU|nr:hypothetical protein [Actinokineospora fastidiosa]GGS61376.1 hypothetical protein GCM10010171_65220 [Actinokineospora fastidiosa]
MSLLREIGEVMTARPTPAAPPDVVADWFDRKADLLDAIAADTGTTPAQAAHAAQCATAARVHAHELRHGGDH